MRKSEFDDFETSDGFFEDTGDASIENEPEGEDLNGDGEYPDDGEFIEDENDEYTEEDFSETEDGYTDGDPDDPEGDGVSDGGNDDGGKKKGLPLTAKIGFIFLAAVILFAAWALGTKSGRGFCMGFVARFVKTNAGTNTPDDEGIVGDSAIPTDELPNGTINVGDDGSVEIIDKDGNKVEDTFIDPRSEDYVTTYLIFGLEQIDGAANTDAIMLVSINTKDNTIKMTSLLRDTYVKIPGWDKNKLNSAYAKGAHGAETGSEARARGAALLMKTIEQTYDVKISGYASVNFNSFEKIVDRLGGLDIELGEKEAKYLNTTNYISNPEYRNVVPGWNHLNGNQVMGYVRVRKEETLGGSNNDYGRTVRQRRVITAIINKYKSTKLTDLFSLTKDLLGYVNTNLTEKQIQDALTMIVNNGIYTTKSFRVPYGETFSDSGEAGIYNGSKYVTWTLVMSEEQLQDNIKALHRFIFLDPEEP
ncbi:MAG: LCP family protein [Lachnospiraceae bacterium]|nr:LCP family protein [Lachnospiraceae bacterium]